MNTTESWDWAIVDEFGGVVDRYLTEDDADDSLGEGDWPDGCRIVYSPDPFVGVGL